MRVLLIGGGCRGLGLTENLVADGHAVRAVTRDEGKRRCIEHAGAECWIGDPDVVGTLRYALENVTILIWALGTASGTADEVAALHGPRLEMMLSKSIDTTVRGIVYEAAGSVVPEVLEGGIDELKRTCERNEMAFALLRADPCDANVWVGEARATIDRLLGIG